MKLCSGKKFNNYNLVRIINVILANQIRLFLDAIWIVSLFPLLDSFLLNHWWKYLFSVLFSLDLPINSLFSHIHCSRGLCLRVNENHLDTANVGSDLNKIHLLLGSLLRRCSEMLGLQFVGDRQLCGWVWPWEADRRGEEAFLAGLPYSAFEPPKIEYHHKGRLQEVDNQKWVYYACEYSPLTYLFPNF